MHEAAWRGNSGDTNAAIHAGIAASVWCGTAGVGGNPRADLERNVVVAFAATHGVEAAARGATAAARGRRAAAVVVVVLTATAAAAGPATAAGTAEQLNPVRHDLG